MHDCIGRDQQASCNAYTSIHSGLHGGCRQGDSRGNLGQALAQELCKTVQADSNPQLAAWRPLLGQLHLSSLSLGMPAFGVGGVVNNGMRKKFMSQLE